MPPKISVVIPCYNCESYIENAIESVISTNYPNVEIIVIDDGSVDKSLDVVENLSKNSAGLNILSFQHPDKGNYGAGKTRNLGIEKSTGDYLCFLDADDIYFKNRFKSAIDTLEANSELDAVFEPYCYFSENGKTFAGAEWQSAPFDEIKQFYPPDLTFPISKDPFRDRLEGKCQIHIGTITVRKEVVEDVGGFPEDFFPEDMVFLLKVLARNKIVQIGEKPVEGYRIHQTSTCSRIGDKPEVFTAPLEALLRAYRWMKNENVSKEYMSIVKKSAIRKIWYYTPIVSSRDKRSIWQFLRRILLTVKIFPELLFSVKLWKVLVRLSLKLRA